LPLVAITVIGNVPIGVPPLVFTVKVVDPEPPEIDDDATLEIAPMWVAPSTLRLTASVKLPTGQI
jgi:hypothetical protein